MLDGPCVQPSMLSHIDNDSWYLPLNLTELLTWNVYIVKPTWP